MSNKKRISKKREELQLASIKRDVAIALGLSLLLLKLSDKAKIASQKLSEIKFPLGGFIPDFGPEVIQNKKAI